MSFSINLFDYTGLSHENLRINKYGKSQTRLIHNKEMPNQINSIIERFLGGGYFL
jgi:hypothetical protein